MEMGAGQRQPGLARDALTRDACFRRNGKQFFLLDLETACPQAVEEKCRRYLRHEGVPAPEAALMHSRRYAVAAVSFDRSGAAAERAEHEDCRKTGE